MIVSVVATLMALVLPAIQRARMAARRTECLNHLRNVGLAVQSFASVNHGRVPSLHLPMRRGDGSAGWSPWPVALLPHLDQRGLYAEWADDPQPDLVLSVLTCPADPANANRPGALSYVVNCGYGLLGSRRFQCPGPGINCGTCPDETAAYDVMTGLQDFGGEIAQCHFARQDDGRWVVCRFDGMLIPPTASPGRLPGLDWDANGRINTADDAIARATGVFWNPRGNAPFLNTLDWVSGGDGVTQTLMLSEHTSAGLWGRTSVWVRVGGNMRMEEAPDVSSSPLRFLALAGDKGFGISTEAFRDAGGAFVFPVTERTHSFRPGAPLHFDRVDLCGSGAASCPTLNHTSPLHLAPASTHAGGVNAVFCDGRATFLSEQIDATVYARLLTPWGTRYGQTPLSDSDY